MFGFRIVREKDLAQWFDQFYQAGYSQAIMSRDTYPMSNLLQLSGYSMTYLMGKTPIPEYIKEAFKEES